MGPGDTETKKLELPYYPETGKTGEVGHGFVIHTIDEKNVAKYCGISVLEVDNLNYIDYLVYRRDARIYNLSQTEDGQKYLKNAWRINQTAPDRQSLRSKIGRKKEDSKK